MRPTMRTACLAAGVCLLLTASASAQPARERGYVTFNAGVQPASSDISDRSAFDLYAERASVDHNYPGKQGLVVDGGGGFRLWRQLGAGVSASYRTSEGELNVRGSLPHPFFLDRPRTFEGTMSSVGRTETGIHVQALYFLPDRGRWRFVLAAGPSFFSLEQELAEGNPYRDEYPHDEVEFREPPLRRFTGSGVGFNAGVNVTFRFGRQFGVGGLVRFARASIDLDGPDSRRIDSDAGGLQAGAGVRIVF